MKQRFTALSAAEPPAAVSPVTTVAMAAKPPEIRKVAG